MIERPILFSTPMVNANLAGLKTQTRRVIKPQPTSQRFKPEFCFDDEGVNLYLTGRGIEPIRSPYGKAGDQLWVREAWSLNFYGGHTRSDGENREIFEQYAVEYKAIGDPLIIDRDHHDERLCHLYDSQRGNFRPSIHMPRWASRIQLEIIEIRVERLQDINEADAQAEGVERWQVGMDKQPDSGWWRDYSYSDEEAEAGYPPLLSAKESYRTLWESINGAGSWDTNPWVWVIEYKMINRQTEASA